MLAITLAAAMLICGYLLGRLCTRARCRRLRTDLAKAAWLAEHDHLTGLLNRAGAESYYEDRTAAGGALAAVLIDLDGFKSVNDTWGHQAGDAKLVAIADRLAAACAARDAMACRLSGDEFLLLLPDAGTDASTCAATDPAAPSVEAQVSAILTQLSTPITLIGMDAVPVNIVPSASAGIARPEGDTAWLDLLRHADIALYQAKAIGGQAVLYTSGMRQPQRHGIRGVRMRDSALVNYA